MRVKMGIMACTTFLLAGHVELWAAQPLIKSYGIRDQVEQATTDSSMAKMRERPGVKDVRIAQVDFSVLANMRGEIVFDFFPDRRIIAEMKEIQNYSNLHDAHSQWVGTPVSDPEGSVTVSIWNNQDVFIRVFTKDEAYLAESMGDGLVMVTHVDLKSIPPLRDLHSQDRQDVSEEDIDE